MKIVTLALIVFFLYQLLIWGGYIPVGTGRDNFEQSMITAERWRYQRLVPRVVLVGSSKTNFFDYDVLGDDIGHFGFGGQGCLTGLEILSRSKEVPALVLVEVGDTLQWAPDETAVAHAVNAYQLADLLPALQHRFQPAAVLLSCFNRCRPKQEPEPIARAHLIQIQTEDNSAPLRDDKREMIWHNANRAKQLIDSLQVRGSQVVLFDPPVEKEVSESRYVKSARTLAEAQFPATHYTWLLNPGGPWFTRDGTHFQKESGTRYSRWLRAEIDRLLRASTGRARSVTQDNS